MRDIKFRVWDIKNSAYFKFNEYVESFSVFDLVNDEACFFGDCITGRHDEFILEQFTGLTDKNGKEIYEGDILNCHRFYFDGYSESEEEFNSMIEYNQNHCAFMVIGGKCDDDDSFVHLLSDFLSSDPKGIEIIGNIHQNSDLLK